MPEATFFAVVLGVEAKLERFPREAWFGLKEVGTEMLVKRIEVAMPFAVKRFKQYKSGEPSKMLRHLASSDLANVACLALFPSAA